MEKAKKEADEKDREILNMKEKLMDMEKLVLKKEDVSP
jgi:hypothetical protein